MERAPSAQHPSKPRRKLTKIIYISDPKIVKASASEFRTLVQELTGQGSRISNTKVHESASGPLETGISRVSIADEVADDEVSSIVSSFMEDDLLISMRGMC